MNLQLYITQKETKDYLIAQRRFTVVDLDQSENYPLNFVCMLPLNLKEGTRSSSIFEGLFGKESVNVAKKLLEKALQSHSDLETKKAIQYRLKLLAPKPKNMVKCVICGNNFEYRNYRFGRRKTCNNCRIKVAN